MLLLVHVCKYVKYVFIMYASLLFCFSSNYQNKIGEKIFSPSVLIFHFLCWTGVWASRLIPKGKRFGPFVGERKKRSQVTSNVYMWEVG